MEQHCSGARPFQTGQSITTSGTDGTPVSFNFIFLGNANWDDSRSDDRDDDVEDDDDE